MPGDVLKMNENLPEESMYLPCTCNELLVPEAFKECDMSACTAWGKKVIETIIIFFLNQAKSYLPLSRTTVPRSVCS